MIHNLVIDVTTRNKNYLIRRLSRLKSTISVRDGGEYQHDRNYSQIHIDTTKTESELDDWLYKLNDNIDYVGVFERGN